MFNDNLFTENYTLSLSSLVFVCRIHSLMSLIQQNMFVLSANKINLNSFEALKVSLIYIINNFDAKMGHCGTP